LIINNQNKLVNFQNEIENSGLNKALKSGEKIALPIEFANGDSKVVNNGNVRNLINRIRLTLKKDKDAKFVITGYASSVGRADLNMELSKDRAKNVRAYIEKYVPKAKGHIQTFGKGESDLICNDNGYAVYLGNGEYKCENGTENEPSSRRVVIVRIKEN